MAEEKPGESRQDFIERVMYLIDTDVMIWVLRGNRKYVDILQDLKDKSSLSISTITVAEIYKNIYPSELLKMEALINALIIRDVTHNVAKQAGFYWQQYCRKLKNLHLLDCIIAATAKEYGLTLLTLNTRHFPMDDIRAVDPGKI